MSLHKSWNYKMPVSPQKKKEDLHVTLKTAEQLKKELIETLGQPIIVNPQFSHYIKQRYAGTIDPDSRKKDGQGKFIYNNPFFTYDGEWYNGKKHGKGKLTMTDGSFYEGEFLEGEITGEGRMVWRNKGEYKGHLLNGEKHGNGIYEGSDGERYEGEWYNNLKQGKGKNVKDGVVIQGEFFRNKPHGDVIMAFPSGERYEGKINMGIREGIGILQTNSYMYEGSWAKDMMDGAGKIKYFDNPYEYEGDYIENKPKITANLLRVILPNKGTEETVETGRTKKDKKTEEIDPNKVVINYEIGGPLVDIEFWVMYQPPDYVDPVQPTKEEIEEQIKQAQKDAKKTKKTVVVEDFYKPRMVTPDPYVMTSESGRIIELSLESAVEPGQEAKKFRLDYRQAIKDLRAEIALKKKEQERILEEQKEQERLEAEQQAQNKNKNKKDKKASKQVIAPAAVDESIKLFNAEEEESNKSIQLITKEGKASVSELELPEDFPTGTYKLKLIDRTNPNIVSIIPTIECEFNIYPPGGDDKKKKKK